jgi:hypothetical protein
VISSSVLSSCISWTTPFIGLPPSKLIFECFGPLDITHDGYACKVIAKVSVSSAADTSPGWFEMVGDSVVGDPVGDPDKGFVGALVAAPRGAVGDVV